EAIGAATVERYFRHGLEHQFREWHAAACPQILGIDEHFFTRRRPSRISELIKTFLPRLFYQLGITACPRF
ncbi:MAG: hypothetical protein WCB12_19755, partial [Bryobacteraceae bacterium]